MTRVQLLAGPDSMSPPLETVRHLLVSHDTAEALQHPRYDSTPEVGHHVEEGLQPRGLRVVYQDPRLVGQQDCVLIYKWSRVKEEN